MAETEDRSGALFRVAAPKTPKHPNFTGSCTINGRRYWIAGWSRTISQGERAGEKYLKLKFTLVEEQACASRPSEPPPTDNDPMPF